MTKKNNDDIVFGKPEKNLQDNLIDHVVSELEAVHSYYIMLIGAAIIASLGLLVGSTAVVIGAMLIAPLFWPLIGFSMGIITTRQHLARKSAILLVSSFVVVFFSSFIIGLLFRYQIPSPELITRSNPTILDLFIALITGVIGMLAIYHPRISQSASGVAISISLLPALCASGLGVAMRQTEIFSGAFLLFSTNTAAVILSGVITLYLLEFRPKRKEEVQRLRIGLAAIIVIIILISTPLAWFSWITLEHERVKFQVNEILRHEVGLIAANSFLDKVFVEIKPQIVYNAPLKVVATVFVSEDIRLLETQRLNLLRLLEQKTNRQIELELRLIKTLGSSPDHQQESDTIADNPKDPVADKVTFLVQNYLITSGLSQKVTLGSVDVSTEKPPETLSLPTNDQSDVVVMSITITLISTDTEKTVLETNMSQELSQLLSQVLSENFSLTLNLLEGMSMTYPSNNSSN